jgi:hypothetical protein
MSTPALIYLALTFLGLGVAAEKSGKPRTGNHSFWATFLASLICCGLLYWGGFFNQVSQ